MRLTWSWLTALSIKADMPVAVVAANELRRKSEYRSKSLKFMFHLLTLFYSIRQLLRNISNLFAQGTFSDSEHENFIRGTAVHELAHKIHIHKVCPNNPSAFCLIFDIGESLYWDANPVTGYDDWYWERWAEMVTDWVYDSDYQQRPEYETPRNNVNADQIKSIERILGP